MTDLNAKVEALREACGKDGPRFPALAWANDALALIDALQARIAEVERVTVDEARLREIARLCASTYGQEHAYAPAPNDETWQAHDWVIEAMKAAIRSR